MNAIEISSLSKTYSGLMGRKKVEALLDFSLNVDQGTFFGLLGPNGAGKTTLVKILLGITNLTGGSANVLGRSISDFKVKKKIGYLPENHQFPQYLTGEQILSFFGGFSDLGKTALKKRIDYLLDITQMAKWRKHKIKAYSKGMMQRLGIAQALVNDPDLIFLDEPTDGVDPMGRKDIRDLLLQLKNEGKTIFLNSHLLSEVEMVADNVAILDRGRIIRQGDVKSLTESGKEYEISIDGTLNEGFETESGIEGKVKQKSEDTFTVQASTSDEINKVIDLLRSKEYLIRSVVPMKDSLEDIFVSLINEQHRRDSK